MKHPFKYQAPTPEHVEAITKIREACENLYELLLKTVPVSRERSIAVTKLEEVSMWANKGIVFSEPFEGGGDKRAPHPVRPDGEGHPIGALAHGDPAPRTVDGSRKRARVAVSTINTERAKNKERSNITERAKGAERTTYEERATGSDSTKDRERAMKRERANSWERVNSAEGTMM